MSEFTDFFALQTDAATLGALRGALVEHVGGADIPLDELPFEALLQTDLMEKAWSKTPKPLWITLGITGTLSDLGKLGPALHVQVEEDFTSWSLDATCDGATFTAAFLREGQEYREATYGKPLYDPALHAEDEIAPCLGLTEEQLKSTLVADGATSFSEALGIRDMQMVDMRINTIIPGEVTMGLTD